MEILWNMWYYASWGLTEKLIRDKYTQIEYHNEMIITAHKMDPIFKYKYNSFPLQ
jgi:hypothetical protein